ncbi:hypothetical protein BDP81DRAFT_458860 [Colletotrichum phormii]|uniref:Uncharacterized protein n=1 Tax=Colletotrichum phormii TaxID=359342 RepID=A0AAI9ZW98_9PEZI|nr:uncharacterized protein BDP81DRAFT_458860 [Colletotrichum phormii]KAK1639372.1 hypothetical protein BDP81DRAFT_458860 [Colletotrichum phormii]
MDDLEKMSDSADPPVGDVDVEKNCEKSNEGHNVTNPLNLPKWHKQLVVGIIVLYAISGLCLISALSALIVFIMPDYQRDGITPDQISNLFTFPNLFLPWSRKPPAVLCATNRNYYWHLGGRMVAAFAAAQCQALALLIMQVRPLWILSLVGHASSRYTPPPKSFSTPVLSWYWLFAGLSGLAMILTFFFVPETAYDRLIEAFMGSHPTDRSNLLPAAVQTTGPDTITRSRSPGPKYATVDERPAADLDHYKDRTFTSNLQIFVYKPTWSRCWLCLKQIGQVFLFPHVLWVAVNNGLFQGIDVSIQMTYAEVLLGQVFIALLCVPLIGWLSDYVIRSSARRNHGVHEPEKRLIAWILPMVTALILTVLYGYVLKNPERTVGTAYLIDSHPSFAGAILVALPVTRGLVGFGLSKHTTTYIANIGPVKTFVRRLCAQMTQ